MIVTLISQCEKKAIARTQRILDAFANRIGDATWQTIITEDGLNSLRMQLKKSASKNTAVACHWIRSKKRTELLWIVGNREKFNTQGFVPVNVTQKNILHEDWESDWQYLPGIKALVGLSALLHDLGKASNSFQSKLRENRKIGDPYRHEWISVYLFCNWLKQIKKDGLQDSDWIDSLAHFQKSENFLKDVRIQDFSVNFSGIPPIALLVCWLILSHHKLPSLPKSSIGKERHLCVDDLSSLMQRITAQWGYENGAAATKKYETVKLSELENSDIWCKQLQEWAHRLSENISSLDQSFKNGCWRLIALYAHLCLTLGDHFFSSLGIPASKRSRISLYANTENHNLKQHLDDHLVGVCNKAVKVANYLPQFAVKMEFAHDLRKLSQPSPERFHWQDKAVKAIEKLRSDDKDKQYSDVGYFIVNMASTGQGKTIANAKILRALSPDQNSLRYILALGLRTLTLQTGDSYRNDIELQPEDLATVIGSETIKTLHEMDDQSIEEERHNEYSSESALPLIDQEIEFSTSSNYEFLDVLFQNKEEKLKAFLYKPVLCCTIDHMMPATEALKGGRFILPTLRLMSSDLIIDEIDDFTPNDLVAISRLVHLAGMLGRKVMISSATIPPDLATGLFDAYQAGRSLYLKFKGKPNSKVYCMWVDEFKSQIQEIALDTSALPFYQTLHCQYAQQRCRKLKTNVVKHLAYLIDYQPQNRDKATSCFPNDYFDTLIKQIYCLHKTHAEKDPESGKLVSFGLIRMANVKPCIGLSRYLLNSENDEFDIKVLAYHSRELLLVRNSKEKYLDTVLKRKESNPLRGVQNPIVNRHIKQSRKSNIIFIVVCTPVEEVGRDHDFDWAIIEPSSMRSIIQLAGRVRRHRTQTTDIKVPNIGVMEFNIKGAQRKNPAFNHPGFEGSVDSKYVLQTKDMRILVDWNNQQLVINAIPRISKPENLSPNLKLADLEHAVISDKLLNKTDKGAASVHGWLSEAWFLTALPQLLNPFRESQNKEIALYKRLLNDEFIFCFKDENNTFHKGEIKYNICSKKLTEREKSHLWLTLDFSTEVEKLLKTGWKDCETIEEIFSRSPELGEILLLESNPSQYRNIYIENLGLICGEKMNHD